MLINSTYLRMFLSAVLLWMVVFPVVSVCGMSEMSEAKTVVIPTSCCPSKALEKSQAGIPVLMEAQKPSCHPVTNETTHDCNTCPCEFKAQMLVVKSIQILPAEGLKIPVIFSNATLIETHQKSEQTHFPPLISAENPNSGSPIFIRNCTWLI
jgi:hypothetical protein